MLVLSGIFLKIDTSVQLLNINWISTPPLKTQAIKYKSNYSHYGANDICFVAAAEEESLSSHRQ